VSISSALNNALSGLTVSSRSADVVSSNIANAMTEGYGVRNLDVGSRIGGGDGSGAQVLGVLRDSDPVLTGQRRSADADVAAASGQAAFLRQVEDLIGLPGDDRSLSARLAEFEARMIDAANGPHDEVRLAAAVDAADSLVLAFGDMSAGLQATRERADAAIGATVTEVNQSLAGIADINSKIRAIPNRSGDLSALLDAQARLVDQLAAQIPVETRRDAAGALQVFSKGGEILVDRKAAVLEFQTTPAIDATMLFGELDAVGHSDRRAGRPIWHAVRTPRRRGPGSSFRPAGRMGASGTGAARRSGP
jgi:flagellar hook-associated protein 1 FlgK